MATTQDEVLAEHPMEDASEPDLADLLARGKGPWWTRLTKIQRGAIVAFEFAIVLLLWQYLIETRNVINPAFVPPPREILTGLSDLLTKDIENFTAPRFIDHLKRSGYEYILGYTVAAAFGIFIGLGIGSSLAAYRLTGPLIWSLYATPWVALRPMATIWFGFGAAPIVFLVFVGAWFPVLLNTAAGVQTIDRTLIRSAMVFGATKIKFSALASFIGPVFVAVGLAVKTGNAYFLVLTVVAAVFFWTQIKGTVFRMVILPSTLPFILIGLRHAVVIGMIAMVVGEIVGASVGLGSLIVLKTQLFQSGAAFAVIGIIVVATLLFGELIKFLARMAAPWHFTGRNL